MRHLPLFLCLLAATMAAQTLDQAALEKEFQESMTGVLLEGHSSRDGRDGVSPDKYVIEKVVKQSGDTWAFYAKVEYKGQAMTVPIPIQVKWAGDTPVITMTDQALPGIGAYTARVVVYRGHYAGTWSGRNGGGKVFGRIVKQ